VPGVGERKAAALLDAAEAWVAEHAAAPVDPTAVDPAAEDVSEPHEPVGASESEDIDGPPAARA
jgi:hypothetical protein